MPTIAPYLDPPFIDLEPPMWRSLLARAAVFHATRTKLSILSDLVRHGGAVQGALRDLEMQAHECSAHDLDDEAAVTRVVEAWDAALTRTLTLTHLDEQAHQLLAELQILMRCARGADPFRRIFVGISSMASALYGSAWRPTRLCVVHVRSHPRNAPPYVDPYALTATTPWPAGTEATVELQIFCDAFGPAAYAAVPILLIHECICHVPARQDRARNDSAFAEGFLDWAAYFFFDRWVGKLDTELAPAARRHARELLTSRTDTPEGWARQAGHGAADTLMAWFEGVCGLEQYESELRVARLAVQLNLLERSLKEKDNFVSRLAWPLPPDLQDALRKWMSCGDAETFLAEAVTLG